jgi:3-oxosteroid 1-dehydrogenase
MGTGWDLSVDLVSVGSGLGGSAAAIAAADTGLEAMILEKAPLIGGSTVYSYGILWVPNNHHQRRMGVPDSTDEARRYMTFLGAGRQWEEHVETYLEYAPVALEYFERVAGVPFYPVQGLPDHYYPTAPGSLPFGRNVQVEPFPATTLGEWQARLRHSPYVERVTFEEMARWGGRNNEQNWDRAVLAERELQDVRTFGAGLAGYFLCAALRRAVPLLVDTPVERLVVERGTVCGVEASQAGRPLRIQARKGVLLATGAYGANARLVRWFDEYPPAPTNRPPQSSEGDGLVLAMEHGAAIAIEHGSVRAKLHYVVPGETVDGVPVGRDAGLREVAAPHSLLVNRDGERFGDESFFEDIAIKLRHFDLWRHAYTNRPSFLIFDQQFWDRYGFGPIPPGDPVPDWIARGETLAELAATLGIDGERLVTTVERFNRFAAEGRDEDFHRGEGAWMRQVTGDLGSRENPNLRPANQPPFYGLELHTGDTRSAGLVTNRFGQVIHVRGHPLPGLYACGEVAAQLQVGVGYQAGNTLGHAITFGYRAVQHVQANC